MNKSYSRFLNRKLSLFLWTTVFFFLLFLFVPLGTLQQYKGVSPINWRIRTWEALLLFVSLHKGMPKYCAFTVETVVLKTPLRIAWKNGLNHRVIPRYSHSIFRCPCVKSRISHPDNVRVVENLRKERDLLYFSLHIKRKLYFLNDTSVHIEQENFKRYGCYMLHVTRHAIFYYSDRVKGRNVLFKNGILCVDEKVGGWTTQMHDG